MTVQSSRASAGSFAHRWRWTLLLLACTLVAGMIGYASGQLEDSRRSSVLDTENRALLSEMSALQDRQSELRRGLVRLEAERAVDTQALEEARATIVALETQVTELESELGFYRSIMAPSKSKRGLQLEGVTLSPTAADNVFDYSLTVMQVGNNDRFRSGRVMVTIKGAINGEPASMALHAVSEGVDEDGIKYRFRYFQSMDGRLVLPDGFAPETVEVVLRGRSNSQPVVEETWRWSQLVAGDASNS